MSTAAPVINPCRHMRPLVHRYAEGTLAGVLLKYVTYHVSTCQRCRQAVEVLRATLNRLRLLKEPAPELPTERWSSIEAAWLELEQTGPPE
jgi:hypothetical protein